jgi:ubiquinone/menaquinone biosynthesis C-methylase UbiE
MLRLAQHPVQESHITVSVTLLCANIAEVHFVDDTFDLIYSIGVLGEFLPFDGYLCENVARMLKRGGRFVFTTVYKNSPRASSWKRRAAETLLPALPIRLKRIVQVRLRSLSLSEAELQSIMDQTQLSSYTMKKRYSPKAEFILCVWPTKIRGAL